MAVKELAFMNYLIGKDPAHIRKSLEYSRNLKGKIKRLLWSYLQNETQQVYTCLGSTIFLGIWKRVRTRDEHVIWLIL
jgi:hypothetical protein